MKRLSFAAALALLVGCTVPVTTSNGQQSGQKPGSTSSEGQDSNAPDKTGGTDGTANGGTSTGGDGTGGNGGNGSTAASFAEVTDMHWAHEACSNGICHDILMRSDGTYLRQMILMNDGKNPSLVCEHGTWKQVGGSIEFDGCKGAPYQNTWSQSSGELVLQGVRYKPTPGGTFNCGPNDC